eukprot:gene8882-3761_t
MSSSTAAVLGTPRAAMAGHGRMSVLRPQRPLGTAASTSDMLSHVKSSHSTKPSQSTSRAPARIRCSVSRTPHQGIDSAPGSLAGGAVVDLLGPPYSRAQPPLVAINRQDLGVAGTEQGILSRRGMGMFAMAAALGMGPGPAEASKLPGFADSAWEAMGGGGADLYFPDQFIGVWDVMSELVKLELPMGKDFVPDMRLVDRANKDELNKPTKFNTASLIGMYYGDSMNVDDRITWNPEDPNVLLLSLPKGLIIRTRVTRRSEDIPEPDRIETSEYFEQDRDIGVLPAEDIRETDRIEKSECFEKYKWREMTPDIMANYGPAVIATQVVSDYLTPYDGDEKYLQSMNKPVVLYTYKLQFRAAKQA